MKCFVIVALALTAVKAGTLQDKYANAKPGFMRIPGWQKIQSGMKKLNQKEPTMKFEPKSDHIPKSIEFDALLKYKHSLKSSFSKIQNLVASQILTLTRLLEVWKLFPMNFHGKSDYSLMDTFVVEPSSVIFLCVQDSLITNDFSPYS